MKRITFFVCIILALNIYAVFPEELIKVRLFSLHKINFLEVNVSAPANIFSIGSGRGALKMIPERNYFLIKSKNNLSVLNYAKKPLAKLEFPVVISFSKPIKIGFDDNFRRCVKGKLALYNFRNDLVVIANIPLEDYIKGIIEAELGHSKNLEALKAQAVTARSYILANLGRHKEYNCDFCDSTHCQLYKNGEVSDLINSAVESTKGQVLKYKKNILPAFYHSTCGGETATPQDVFGKYLPGFAFIQDKDSAGNVFCSSSPHFEWEILFSAEELRKTLNKYPLYAPGGVLKDIRVLSYTASKRAKILLIIGEKDKKITAYKFWLIIGNSLGWGKIESTYFKITPKENGFVFTGHGLGHGVGLCQYGADEMARKGYSCEQILKHYFPKAKLDYY